jgi:hypothetical protein
MNDRKTLTKIIDAAILVAALAFLVWVMWP